MMHWFAMIRLRLQLRAQKPSQRTIDTVCATLNELGFGDHHITDEFAGSVAARLATMTQFNQVRREERITELLKANEVDVNRRRSAEQTMRGMLAYADEYAPETAPAFRAIAASNGITL